MRLDHAVEIKDFRLARRRGLCCCIFNGARTKLTASVETVERNHFLISIRGVENQVQMSTVFPIPSNCLLFLSGDDSLALLVLRKLLQTHVLVANREMLSLYMPPMTQVTTSSVGSITFAPIFNVCARQGKFCIPNLSHVQYF